MTVISPPPPQHQTPQPGRPRARMFHSFTVGGDGAMHTGPPTKSECGQLWDAYMSECCEEEFPYHSQVAASRAVHIWAGRQLELLLAAGGQWVRAHVVSLKQSNSGPFCPCTFWSMELMLSQAAAEGPPAEILRADQLGTVELSIRRADVLHGGVLEGAGFRREVVGNGGEGGYSFRWLSPPTPQVPADDFDSEREEWHWPWTSSGVGSAEEPWSLPEAPEGTPARVLDVEYAPLDAATIQSKRAQEVAEFAPLWAQARVGQTAEYQKWVITRMRRILELANDELIESLVAQRVPNPLEDAIAMMPIAALISDGCMQYLTRQAGPTLCHALVAALPKRRAELQEHAARIKSDELLDRLVGKRVRIDGLVGRPELNGKLGTAVRYHTEKGRYAVELEGVPPREHVLLKPVNLQPTVVVDSEGEDARLDDVAPFAFTLLGVRVSSFLHRAAELYEQEEDLQAALLFYRRNVGWSAALIAKGDDPRRAANDYANLAICLRKLGHLREALQMYERALACHGDGPEAAQSRAGTQGNRARCLRDAADWNGTAGEYADLL